MLAHFVAFDFNVQEMNAQCFHHDDLDDDCCTPSFVKAFLKTQDFYAAFNVGQFPFMDRVLSLNNADFVTLWMKDQQVTAPYCIFLFFSTSMNPIDIEEQS